MKITATLSRYVAGLYFRNAVFLLAGLLAVIYLFDTVELIRRASKVDGVPLSLILQMGLLKLPEVGQILFPFAILFGAMFTFWQLNRRHELVVVRSAGFSVWQLLAPVIGVAIVIGVMQITVINPIGALLVAKFEDLERKHLSRQSNQIAVFKEGLWLRQPIDDETGGAGDKDSERYVILHAKRVSQPDWVLQNLGVLYFDANDSFVQRLDAPKATLEKGRWVFRDAVINTKDGEIKGPNLVYLPTRLSVQDVQESFMSPAAISFWQLPGFIETLEETGFDASSLRVHYQNLLAQPLLFAAMVLLAAIVSMRPPRFRGGLLLFASGVFMGFVVFFMSSFMQALGASQQIPVVLAAWSPALICFMLGVSMVINLEDG